MRFSRKFLRAVGAFALIVGSAALAQAQTIRLITLEDVESFRVAKNDVEMVSRFFSKNAEPAKMKFSHVALNGAATTPQEVLDKLDAVPCDKDDLIVFYYSGHGANDGDYKGQYFNLKGKDGKAYELYRWNVRETLVQKGARQVVLFSDCCNVLNPPSDRGVEKDAPPNVKACAAFNELFVKPRGVLDATSSKFGEYSFVAASGSIATMALIDTFNELDRRVKDDPNASIAWRDVVQTLCDKADLRFKAKYPKDKYPNGVMGQKTQIPHVYEFPGVPRLGVRAITLQTGNVKVTGLVDGTPGAEIFKVDDVVTHINGQETLDEVDFSRAIDSSPQNATITFKRDGVEKTIDVKLNGMPVRPLEEPTTNARVAENDDEEEAPRERPRRQNSRPSRPANESASGNDAENLASPDPSVYGDARRETQNDDRDDREEPRTNRRPRNNGESRNAQGSEYVFGAKVQGNKVVEIAPGSPAEDAGLEVGDVIRKFDGRRISNAQDFSDAVDAAPVDVTIVVDKENGEKNVELYASLNKTYVFGAKVQGNKIVEIAPGSPAEDAGLAVGDVIVTFDGRRISTADDFSNAVDAAGSEAKLIVSTEGGERQTVVVTLNK